MALSQLYLAKHTGAEIDAAVDLANTAVQPEALESAVEELEGKISNVNDTTYTFAEGTTNGTISVTEDGGSPQDVPVKGLGSAAYTEASAYDVAGAATTVKNELTSKIEEVESTIEEAQTDLTTKIEAVDNKADANTTAIGKITPVVPTEATAENQLVDEKTMHDFVNSSIAAQAANFITPTADGGQFESFDALKAGPWYMGGVEVDGTTVKLTKNDYAMYLKTTDAGTAQWRALYNGTSWEEQYQVGSAFTAAQQSALDSGITAAKVAAIATNTQNITDLTTKVNGMYDNKTIDEKIQDAIDKIPEIPEATAETAGIVKLGATGGAAAYDALQNALDEIATLKTTLEAIEDLLSADGYDVMFVKKGANA